ncbi:unnamed protein product, partial [Rotaria magnacalcarata]
MPGIATKHGADAPAGPHLQPVFFGKAAHHIAKAAEMRQLVPVF